MHFLAPAAFVLYLRKSTATPWLVWILQPAARRRSLSQCESGFSVNKRFVVWLTNSSHVLRFVVSGKKKMFWTGWGEKNLSVRHKKQQSTMTGSHVSVIMCWEGWNVVLVIGEQALQIWLTAPGYGLRVALRSVSSQRALRLWGEQVRMQLLPPLPPGGGGGPMVGDAGEQPPPALLQPHACSSCSCEGASCQGEGALIWISLLNRIIKPLTLS